jgi:cystathionine beta-lyase
MQALKRPDTRLTHSGNEEPQLGRPVSPPIYRQSTLTFSTVQEFHAVHGTVHTYGRHGNPTTRAVERMLCDLEGGEGVVLTPSGVSAITTALLAVLSPGDHLLMTDAVYGPTRLFCDETLARFGVETTYYDPLIGSGIDSLMRPNTRAVFTESPASLTFEVQDIPAISAVAHEHGALVINDNSWGTPLHFRSFSHGVDISVHSASKYIGGHSDLVMGVVMTTDSLHSRVRSLYRELGLTVGADDASLALRGLRTLAVRLERHERNALALAQWLEKRPEVAEVLYPALSSSAGHGLWKRDFSGACGLFTIALRDRPIDAVAAMLDGLRMFSMGYSWGGFESLIMPVDLSTVRSATIRPASGALVRLHVGLENVEDLMEDLEKGFERLNMNCVLPS